MNRRAMLHVFGAAGSFAALSKLGLGRASAQSAAEPAPPIPLPNRFSEKTSYRFKPWNPGKTLAPVTQVTPDTASYVHTYFDVTPFSPSQRYLAITRVPELGRPPVLGDLADVCVIDREMQTIQSVYTTKCWGYQTGSSVQWGATDRYLFTNEVVNGVAVCIRIDLETAETLAYAGPLYTVAPDDSCVLGFPHELRDVSQTGYGVPPKKVGEFATLPPGASKDEGIWRTDLATNTKRLVASLADVAAKVPTPPPVEGGTYYFWHTKFNRQGTRLLQVLRYMHPATPDTRHPMMFTFKPDGSELYYTPNSDRVPVWGGGGGHPNWHGDGVHVVRSMEVDGDTERFIQARYDGSGFKILSEKLEGGGHPSIEPRGRFLITDEDTKLEDAAAVKLRLADLNADEEQAVCTIPTIDKNALDDKMFRLDGHPVWSRDYKQVSLPAAPEGKRQLFLVDLSAVV